MVCVLWYGVSWYHMSGNNSILSLVYMYESSKMDFDNAREFESQVKMN